MEVVAQRFELLEQAGRGGMGEVHRARDRTTGEVVALKTTVAEHAARFVEEATALARIEHPAVVRYVAHGIGADGNPFLAMQWIDGVSLGDHLRGKTLDQPTTAKLIATLARGLGAAHRAGILHRDVKPQNVMLRGGSLEDPVLIDFGLARRHGHAGITHTGVLVGTPSYMAPEQARGERDLDARADVFALGCVLFRCLTGTPPFRGADAVAVLSKILLEAAPRLRDVIPRCPPAIDRLASMMLAKDPAQRPSDGDAVASLLDSFDWSASVDPEPTVTVLGAGEQRVVSVILATGELTPEAAAVMQAHGARAESVIYGGVLGLVTGAEQATRSARCALALRGVMPSARIVLATGRADLSGLAPTGEVIECAAAMLREQTVTGVRVDDVTRGLLEARFVVTDDLLVREAPLSMMADGARFLRGKPTPFLGRDNELASLMMFVSRLESEGAGAMLVSGAAGIGKSRVRSELFSRVRAELPAVEVWRARADVMGASLPLGLARQLVASAAGIGPTDDAPAMAVKIAAAVGGDPSDRATAFLQELMGCAALERSDLELARRDAQTMRDQVRLAWTALVRARVQRAPLLVMLEDLHWADPASVALLDATLVDCADLPFGVVAFARPEVHEALPDVFHGCTELRLGPLGKRPARAIVRAALGEVPEDVAQRLVDTAGGNAFYLEELVRSVGSSQREGLPTTVVAVSQTRLERLSPEQRRALRAASVYGERFWRGGLASLTGADEILVASWLSALESEELVVPLRSSRFVGQAEYAFRHAIVREVAYATLTEADAANGHGLAAAWLAAQGERDAHVLADHLLRSDDPSRAIPHVIRLAELALEAGTWPEAQRRAEQANALGATGDDFVRGSLVIAQLALWEGRDCMALAERMVAAARPGSELWCRAISIAAVQATRSVRHDAQDAFERAVLEVAAVDSPSADVVAALAQVAFARLSAGRDVEALFARLSALEPAAAKMNAYTRVRVEHALFIRSSVRTGVTTARTEALRRAIDEIEALGDVRSAVYFRSNLAYGSLSARKLEDAMQDFSRVADTAERLGLKHTHCHALHALGGLALLLGRKAQALDYQRRALQTVVNDERLQHQILSSLARAELAVGDLTAAEAHAQKAAEDPSGVSRGHGLATLVFLALRAGRTEEAVSLATRAREAARTGMVTDDQFVYVRMAHAEALLAADRRDDAKAVASELEAWLMERRGAMREEDPDWRALAELAQRLA